MTNPYRAMCAELVDVLDNLRALVVGECPSLLDGDRGGSGFLDIDIDDALTTARALLAQPEPEGPTDEELLDLADWEVWDHQLLAFARAAIARFGRPTPQPVAEGPTDEEWDALVTRAWDQHKTVGYQGERFMYDSDFGNALDFVRRELARWGRPTPQPVPVSERLPGPEDCTTNPRTSQGQWCWGWVQHDPAPYSGRWRMMRREWLADEATHWLPANALPTPEATNG